MALQLFTHRLKVVMQASLHDVWALTSTLEYTLIVTKSAMSRSLLIILLVSIFLMMYLLVVVCLVVSDLNELWL